MYRKMITFACLLLCSAMLSCNENRVYNEHTTIAGMSWEKGAPVTFRADITETGYPYKLIFDMRHTTTLGFGNFPLGLTIIAPDGSKTTREYVMPILDTETRTWVGEAMGDIVDTSFIMENDHFFAEAGNYTFELRHLTNQEPLQNVMEVGMILEKNVNQGK